MASNTSIQWCDDTVNPVMGCDGCELFETRPQFVHRIAKALSKDDSASAVDAVALGSVAEGQGGQSVAAEPEEVRS